MFPQVQLLPGAIPAIMASATERGCLTLTDRYGLMAAALDEHLEESDRRCIDRLLRAVSRGRLQVVK
ncbi:hypothetical protein [Baaleninema sp.]|uniref:hypothetical protein n=1 Tax=Baaleninema sp. TaxID=3101197 RepID=UPI003D0196E7